MRHAPAFLVLVPLLAAGCSELRTPPGSDVPPGLVVASADPGREAIAAVATAFNNDGAGLTGHPAEAAQAAAQLEWLAQEVRRGGRWRALPSTIPYDLGASVREMRSAIGIAQEADPRAVELALLAAARELRAGNRASALRVLSEAPFQGGGAAVLARLNQVAPVPQTANTTTVLAQEVRRLDVEQRWENYTSPELIDGGITTFGLGGGIGY